MDLYEFTEGIVIWLMDIVRYVLDWLGLHGLADWLGSSDVISFLTLLGQALVIFGVGFVIAITMIWQERKTLGRLMDRRGTRIGPLGYLQQLADGFKTFLKEIIIPAVDPYPDTLKLIFLYSFSQIDNTIFFPVISQPRCSCEVFTIQMTKQPVEHILWLGGQLLICKHSCAESSTGSKKIGVTKAIYQRSIPAH